MIILSRTFTGDAPNVAALRERVDLAREVARIRAAIADARARSHDEMERDRRRIHSIIWDTAASLGAAV
jgi:hypothetical protein